jgi:hypothetical protein
MGLDERTEGIRIRWVHAACWAATTNALAGLHASGVVDGLEHLFVEALDRGNRLAQRGSGHTSSVTGELDRQARPAGHRDRR